MRAIPEIADASTVVLVRPEEDGRPRASRRPRRGRHLPGLRHRARRPRRASLGLRNSAMKDGPDVYRKLQEHIDRMPVGFPATESGVEIRSPEAALHRRGGRGGAPSLRPSGASGEDLRARAEGAVDARDVRGAPRRPRGEGCHHGRALQSPARRDEAVQQGDARPRHVRDAGRPAHGGAAARPRAVHRRGLRGRLSRPEDEADADGPRRRPDRSRAPGGPVRRRAAADRGERRAPGPSSTASAGRGRTSSASRAARRTSGGPAS